MAQRCYKLLLPIVLLTLATAAGLSLHAQPNPILGFPDRIMNDNRIGRLSVNAVPELPALDDTRIEFPRSMPGSKGISVSYGFVRHLLDENLQLDALTLLSEPFSPSDTLSYLRALVLFENRRIKQSAELFSQVQSSSPFYEKSRYYGILANTHAGNYPAAKTLLPPATYLGPYKELAAFEGAALALLENDEVSFRSYEKDFGFEDYALAQSEQALSDIAAVRFPRHQKSPVLAACLSAVLPGSGKWYAGRIGEGTSALLTVGALAAITAENWNRHGLKDWRTILFGSLCATFYLGNIYGSYFSVGIEQHEQDAQQHAVIMYHMHIPLRSIFP